MIKHYFPASHWLTGYTSGLFSKDAVAGITLAAYAIPVSLAYATLAGLPPQYGIYGYLIGGLFYAMLGTSKHMAVGPTSAISLIIGTSIATMSGGDTQRWLDVASLTALVFAVMSIAAYLLRLSSIINFISETVLLGFKAGAAITIGLTQLPKLFGVHGGGTTFFERLKLLVMQLPETNINVLIFGIIALLLIFAGDKLLPGKPVALVVVIISILVISFTPIGALGFKIVGVIPVGLPKFHFPMPKVGDVQSVLPLAFACFILAYVESVSAAKAIAQKNGYDIDPRQELLALGVANMAVAFGHGYPISGGLSQSAVNDKAGAKTPMSLIVASVSIAFCLLFFTSLLQNLPTVILAAIVLVAIRSLIDFKEFKRLFYVNRFDFIIAAVALASVIFFGILEGVLIAAVASLILIIRVVSTPHVAFLGRIQGTNRYSDCMRHPENESIPGMLLFRVESPLLYFNTSNVYNIIWAKVMATDDLKTVVMDMSTSAYIDSSGAHLIKRLHIDLEAKGVHFKIVEAHSEVRDILRVEDIEHLMGHISRKYSVHDIVLGEHLNEPAIQ